MHKQMIGLAFCVAAFAMSATAQTVTGSGYSGVLPVFTGTSSPSSTVGNSLIWVSSGSMGIGTNAPVAQLDVEGTATIGLPQLAIGDGTRTFYLTANEIGADSWERFSMGYGVYWNAASTNYTVTDNVNNQATFSDENGNFVWTTHTGALSPNPPTYAQWHAFDRMVITQYGNVGIGTPSPGSLLDINGAATATSTNNYSSGALRLTGNFWNSSSASAADYWSVRNVLGSGTTPASTLTFIHSGSTGAASISVPSITFSDSSTQTTAWTGVLCGGDYAEAVNAKGSLKAYEPGDVLVIGDGSDGEVQRSAAPYSTMVAGIFATKPGVIGRRQSLLKDAEEIPMAMIGIVPTKVTAENGPIHRGDLLVTSSTTGYAMKGTDRERMLGAVIGKAMSSLDSGTGVIEVLVTLQ
jgi:hypothetical protein